MNIPGYNEFVQRSVDRRRHKEIVRQLFQEGEMPTKMFRHLSALIDGEQKRDERETGFSFQRFEF
jgi:hypothetical protein